MSNCHSQDEQSQKAAPTLKALGFSSFFRSQCPTDRDDLLPARAVPVVVLTKRDLADAPDAFVQEAARLRSGLPVELVNGLDARRLASYHKLEREERHATESIAERRARFRRFGRVVRNAQTVRDKHRQ